MATYALTAGQIAAHDKTLVGSTVDTVTFTDDALLVEVLSDGTSAVYFTADGTVPTVSGANCFKLPAVASAMTVRVATPGAAVVQLISSGTPVYSVTNAS